MLKDEGAQHGQAVVLLQRLDQSQCFVVDGLDVEHANPIPLWPVQLF
jgi:hypothetical protein